MTIQLIVDNVEIPVKHIRFSDGSSNVKLEDLDKASKKPTYISLTVDPVTPMDNALWEIFQVMSALKCAGFTPPKRSYLNLPYLPHGRADRVFEHGNAHPLAIFLDTCEPFSEVFITDPHNLDIVNHYPNVTVIPQSQCFIELVRDIQSGDVLVSPDKGAVRKIEELHGRLHNRGITTFLVKADKKRDVSTGRIIETVLPGDANVKGKRCVIVDDILDAGGTFIPLAQKLKDAGASSVELYVTHGIFAKGLNLFKGVIDKLHVYGTVGTYVTQQDITNFNEGKVTK